MDRRRFVRNSLAGIAGISSVAPPLFRGNASRAPEASDVTAYFKSFLPWHSDAVPRPEVEDGKYLIKQFAPPALSELIIERVPLQLAISGKPLDLQLRKSGPSLLEGRVGDLTVAVRYSYLSDLPALRWNVTLRNDGKQPVEKIAITPLLVRLSLNPDNDHPRVRHLSGSYHFDAMYPPRGFRLTEERVMTHDHCKSVRIASGTTSAYDHVPVLQFAVGPNGNLAGLFVGFEWSSRWYLEARWERYSWMGESRPDFLLEGNVGLESLRLNPDESLELPRIHMGFFEGANWSAADNAVRRYVRDVLAAKLGRQTVVPPVYYDHWFGIQQFFDVEDLKRQANRAAELGCEHFWLDAAWYPVKNNFADGLGNWYAPDPKKFPHGVEELSEHVRKLGMRFGIWHQIELAASGSEVLRRHPELYLDNPENPAGHKHLRTDLPEGRDLALGFLRKWISDWSISGMRWEFADPLGWTYAVDPSGKLNLACMNGLYLVVDTIRSEFPDLYIEGCQGGGTRMDWGFAVRTHGTWLNDHTNYPDVCRFFQTGASRFWPAHFLNSAVRVHRNTGDVDATSHNLLSRMIGVLSFAGDIANWSPAATELARKHVQVYKQIRHVLDGPIVFLLPQPHSDREWDVVLVRDEAGKDLVLYAFRMEGPDSVAIEAPYGRWEQLLGSDKASIEPAAGNLVLRLGRNSSCLWKLA